LSFGTLCLLVVAGILGPLLAAANRRIPVVVGEIAGGLVIGASGFGLINPNDPTLKFLSNVGFAMLMFIVGTHLPFRDPEIRSALGRGAGAAATTGAIAILVGLLIASPVGFRRPMVLAVLLASSSAAVAMPILASVGSSSEQALLLATSWIAIADIGTVLAVPLVLSGGHLGRAIIGGILVLALAALIFAVQRGIRERPPAQRARKLSKKHGWGLDLRISILVLFLLAWVATKFGSSILIAGFATGAIVALLGEPKRVAQQLIGLGEGFFVPLFFVVLGARLDFRALAGRPQTLLLAVGVLFGALLAHLVAARIWRLPAAIGLVATGQLGVPSAVVAVGLQTASITPAQAAAIMAAVLGSLAFCAWGAALLGSDPESASLA
jgi:Kef-type K+ transport system membrane component KefB